MKKYDWKAVVMEIAHLRKEVSEYQVVVDDYEEWFLDLLDTIDELKIENKKLQKKLKKAKK
jgi:hypothetical protein